MPVRLLDVNVLLPLIWAAHPRHADVRAWFLRQRHQGWATCPITQLGFLRISCVPNVLPAPATPDTASTVLRRWTQAVDHEFWPDDLSGADVIASTVPPLVSHRQFTDAYLIALAVHRGGLLATLDRPLHGRMGVEAIV